VQENKAIVARFFEEAWNQGNLAALAELGSPDCVVHDHFMPEDIHGYAGFERYITMFRTAFPDVHFTLQAQIGEDDLVATRWSATGTFIGPLMGFAPTGTAGEVSGITIMRFAAGKVVETWVERDDLGMLKAMGVAPELATATV
jgi:steroid delta-isomerase-like uncharacterized protein